YLQPAELRPGLLEVIASTEGVAPYFDLSFQHSSPALLRRMRRFGDPDSFLELLTRIRGLASEAGVRSNVIVGFPGETDEEFEDMLGLLEEIRFDHLGAFAYSEEESTPAARMEGQVDAAVKRERLERVMEVQQAITQEQNERWIGREVDVLIDRITGRDMDDPEADAGQRGAVGRTARQALEIDGMVHIDDAAGARAGEFVRARILDVIDNDLKAAILDD
ncbi:MAG TPA: radical SAM protein, partial [Longimicrobiales bacterium]|nr:radical SAM protein [Longimicrobiales bacterium]